MSKIEKIVVEPMYAITVTKQQAEIIRLFTGNVMCSNRDNVEQIAAYDACAELWNTLGAAHINTPSNLDLSKNIQLQNKTW